jgi:hypothetical protein
MARRPADPPAESALTPVGIGYRNLSAGNKEFSCTLSPCLEAAGADLKRAHVVDGVIRGYAGRYSRPVSLYPRRPSRRYPSLLLRPAPQQRSRKALWIRMRLDVFVCVQVKTLVRYLVPPSVNNTSATSISKLISSSPCYYIP